VKDLDFFVKVYFCFDFFDFILYFLEISFD